MATATAAAILPFLLIAAFLLSPAAAQKCKAQKIAGNYTDCSDLPTLNALLHWTYVKSNSTLSVAFSAAPPSADGWVAWALNPTGPKMAGAQSLLAYRSANGSMVVKTLSIANYSSLVESKLSFDVLEKRAEFAGGVMTIFAKLVFPAGRTSMNQIWQVGSSVKDGVPVRHEFAPANINAMAVLQVVAGGPTPAPAPVPTSGSTGNGMSPSPPPPANGASRSTGGWLFQLGGFFLMCGVSIFGF